MNRVQLRKLVLRALRGQGFRTRGGYPVRPSNHDKPSLRTLHATAVEHKIARAKPGLVRHESRLLQRIASGSEVFPERISPYLVQVEPETENELLFRYASLHWSIPVSSGYGRRLRFLLFDDQNGKLMGLMGFGDPLFSLGIRDAWIGWDKERRKQALTNVMDAFVLGAVPPYSFLLCGKLVAMLSASNEVRGAFHAKYGGCQTFIRKTTMDGQLALITTASALGRSSIYNRLRYEGRLLFHSVGFTRGSGEFHFSNGLYGDIFRYANRYCDPTAKQERWGTGFRNKREVIRKCLMKIGLPREWLYHGVRREVFVVPLAQNAQEFLRGDQPTLLSHDQSVDDLFAWFRDRWLLPRAKRDPRYRQFDPSAYTLWKETGA